MENTIQCVILYLSQQLDFQESFKLDQFTFNATHKHKNNQPSSMCHNKNKVALDKIAYDQICMLICMPSKYYGKFYYAITLLILLMKQLILFLNYYHNYNNIICVQFIVNKTLNMSMPHETLLFTNSILLHY